MSTWGVVIAGVAGTTVMILIMGLIHWLGLANADMVRAIGSLFTKDLKNSQGPGLLAHYGAGIVFAFLYMAMIQFAPVQSWRGVLALSGLLGWVHGIIVGLLLMVLVAEHHPIPKFQKAGAGVAIAHVVGHVFYGVTVGAVLRLTHANVELPLGDVLGYAAMWMFIFGIPLFFFAPFFMHWHRRT